MPSRRPKGLRLGMLVVVDWLDAVTEAAGWGPPNTAGPDKVRSVGFVTSCDRAAIVLAGDGVAKNAHGGEVNRSITIPLGMVVKVWRVKVSELERLV